MNSIQTLGVLQIQNTSLWGPKLLKTSTDAGWIVWVTSTCPQEMSYSLMGPSKIWLPTGQVCISNAEANCTPNL